MKPWLGVLALALLWLTGAKASLIPCPSTTGAVTFGEPSSLTFTCGSLTFGDFEVATSDGGAAGIVDINGGTFDSLTGTVSLNLNPNLGSSQDELFLYEVWGGVSQLALALGGTDAQVGELACSSPIPTSGPTAFLCPSSDTLGRVTDFSNNPDQPILSRPFPNTSPVYLMEDIQTGNGRPGGPIGGGELSNLDQTFDPADSGAVPEPVSLVLLGSGLLGLGLLGRRIRKP